MKILSLVHRIPYPPSKGEKIRAFNELRFLAPRHTIDLFCFADSPEEAEGKRALQEFCRHVYVEVLNRFRAKLRAAQALMGRQPLSVAYFFSRSFGAAVRRALAQEKYDVIFSYSSSMAQYVLQSSGVPVVADFVDIDSAKWAQYARVSPFPRSWLYAREARSLRRYEKFVASNCAATIVATPLEALQLNGDGSFAAIEVIRNGVSLPGFGSAAELPEKIRRLQPYVIFVGTMDYLPNVDAVNFFAHQVLPKIQEKHPDLKFVIAGRNPSRRVRKLASKPGVIVTGSISELQPFLLGAQAAVAPLRICQGVQNKILEAMAVGLPVISTSRPAQAIGAVDGESLLVADAPEDFARAVVSVLESPELRARFRGSTEFLRQRYDWNANLSQLEQLLEHRAGLVAATGPRSAKLCGM